MAADEVARQIGALDLTISTVIDTFKEKTMVDFGISTEDGGKYLNEGLISQKEGFMKNKYIRNVEIRNIKKE